jgi:hypothetical protein
MEWNKKHHLTLYCWFFLVIMYYKEIINTYELKRQRTRMNRKTIIQFVVLITTMKSNINGRMLTTFFVAAAAIASATSAMLVTSAVGTSMITPAFAQGDNMTGGGNATEGNMTGSDMAGSGMTTTPPMMPP